MSGGSTKSQSYLDEQARALKDLLAGYSDKMLAGQMSYPGERVAPFTGTQTQALAMGGDFLSAFDPNQPLNLPPEYGSALAGLLGGTAGPQAITPEQTESYFSRAIEDPSSRYFQKYTMPATKEAFAGPGYWSGARAGAQSEAAEDYANWLGGARGQLEWDVGQVNRQIAAEAANRQLSAMPYAQAGAYLPTGVAQQQLQGLGGVFGFMEQSRQLEQANIQANIQRFLEDQRLTDPEVMQIVLALIGQQMQTYEAEGPGLGYVGAGSFMSGLGSAAGGKYGSMFGTPQTGGGLTGGGLPAPSTGGPYSSSSLIWGG